jgi:hypothetical protein
MTTGEYLCLLLQGDETALRKWDGSLRSEPQRRKQGLGEQDKHVLRCLGGSVLMQ